MSNERDRFFVVASLYAFLPLAALQVSDPREQMLRAVP